MSKVFVNIGLSLDGYMAPEGMTMGKPEYKNWGKKWGELIVWIINQQYFRENLKLGGGGRDRPWSWHGKPQAVVIFVSRVARM